MITREQALQSLADFVAECAERTGALTPREAAERAWHPGGPSVDELTEIITANRAARSGGRTKTPRSWGPGRTRGDGSSPRQGTAGEVALPRMGAA